MREQLKREIYKRGENIRTFSAKAGLSRYTTQKVIKGTYKSVNGCTINALAKGLGIKYEEMEKILNASN